MTSSKFVSLSLAIIVASFFVCLPADAQPLSTGKPNSVVIKLDVKDTSKCNIEVSTPWQDKFEVEVNPPSMEAQFEVTPREPGLLVLTWTGKTKFRGLKSVMACTGSGEVRLIAGYTSETAKPMWDKLFSTLSSEQAECVRIGLDSAKLKYSAIDPRTEVIDPTDSKAKSVFARCESFFKIKQSFIDKGTWSETKLISCAVGGVRTSCEGAYGIPLADGNFMPLSRIDAMRYHHENRPWTPYLREPQSLRDARLAQAEQARLEEERQREARRIADEKAAADRAKQAEEERQREAKRIAEEERQREAKRIAEERSAMEKAKAQKNQDKKNVAKDILGARANQSTGSVEEGNNSTFMNGKYRLAHQIPESTLDPDERRMKDDIANRLTPQNERQFWASQNWKDNVVRRTREDFYLLTWDGDLLDAMKKADEIQKILSKLRLNGLGAPTYWLATPKIVYNMSGKFRVGVLFKQNTHQFENTLYQVNKVIPDLRKHSTFEPVVEFSGAKAQLLAQIRGLPSHFEYTK